MTRRTTAATNADTAAAGTEQGALFGDPVPVDTDRARASNTTTGATQDVELVASVLRLAQDPGYRLVERSGRVLRVDPAATGDTQDVPRYEADTVHQLLDGGLLELGGNHATTHHGHTGPARSVLVPKRSRDMAARWSNLRPLPVTPTRPATPAASAARKRSEPVEVSGPIVVDLVRPGRGLLTCREFGGEIVRDDGRYVVETEGGHVVGRASSYVAGARLLARHHGYRPGPIEINHDEVADHNGPPRRTRRDRLLDR